MHLSNVDPISMNEVSSLLDAPFVVEGMGANALVIYFENDANRAAYLGISTATAEAAVTQAFHRGSSSELNGLLTR